MLLFVVVAVAFDDVATATVATTAVCAIGVGIVDALDTAVADAVVGLVTMRMLKNVFYCFLLLIGTKGRVAVSENLRVHGD